MSLHLIKLAVGVDDLAHMKKVQAARRKQRHQGPRTPHWVYTRNTPRRAEELLQGGSLYWVVRGVIRCRQELVGFEEDFDKEEAHKYCRIKVKRPIIATTPRALVRSYARKDGIDFTGTADRVAGMMQELMEEVGGDGFLIFNSYFDRRYVIEICDGLVPELQRRGVTRKAYAHKHLKDNLLEF